MLKPSGKEVVVLVVLGEVKEVKEITFKKTDVG